MWITGELKLVKAPVIAIECFSPVWVYVPGG